MRFGQSNLIAVQLSEFVTRPARLDQLDPQHGRALPGSLSWPFSPAQFEQYLTVGLGLRTAKWEVARLASRKEGESGEAVFEMASDVPGLSASVTYRWNSNEPVLHKFVEMQNHGAAPLRIMNVSLGNYRTGATVTEGEQGFPVYVADEFFMGLAHPYGWVMGQEDLVRLRQFPGTAIKPGEAFQCIEAVYGTAKSGAARQGFLAHLHGRMRRVVRGHNRAYAFFDPSARRVVTVMTSMKAKALCSITLPKSLRANGSQGAASIAIPWNSGLTTTVTLRSLTRNDSRRTHQNNLGLERERHRAGLVD